MDRNHILSLIAEGDLNKEAMKMIQLLEMNVHEKAIILSQFCRFALAKSLFRLGLIDYEGFDKTSSKAFLTVITILLSDSKSE